MHYYYITGTSSGIGKALAKALLERSNTRVVGISRTCTIEHENYSHAYLDLSLPSNLNKAIELFQDGHTVDDSIYLINNAGVIDPIEYAGTYQEVEIQQMLQVNLIASIQLINAFLKIPISTYKERVVLSVSSGAATKVIDGWSLYGAAKAALDHFSNHVAKEIELANVLSTRIFSVAPGVVDTQMQGKIRGTALSSFSTLNQFVEMHANNELVAPNVIAQKYLSILDNPSRFLNTIFSLRDLA